MLGSINDLVGGRYRLLEIVGSGGAGVVWRALDEELSRELAVKLLSCQDDTMKSRIWREARLAALLSSSGAVPLYDYGDDGDHCFLAMELVLTNTLRGLLEKSLPNALALPDLLEIGLGLAQILENAHAMSLIHRDVKPENVFVFGDAGEELSVKLVDFGLAFLGDVKRGSLGRLSDAGFVSGTPSYLSPEQALAGEIGKATDIYSLGCLLYEMCCGDTPFYGSVAEVLSKHIYVPPIPLAQRNSETPEELAALVEHMLTKAPDKRPDIAEVIARLKSVHDDHSPWQIGRSKGSEGGLSRAERMIEFQVAVEPEEISNIDVLFFGQAPSEFSKKMESSGLRITQLEHDADIGFALPCLSADEIATLGVPVLAWVGDSLIDIAALIRRGYRDVVSGATTNAQVRRKVARLVRSSSPAARTCQ
ncbi:MAG: serine/threonine protein kinase [Kofleriaceae bacterium]|nr:serine/threonine protein kinase [Kofleriaceae bacterium]